MACLKVVDKIIKNYDVKLGNFCSNTCQQTSKIKCLRSPEKGKSTSLWLTPTLRTQVLSRTHNKKRYLNLSMMMFCVRYLRAICSDIKKYKKWWEGKPFSIQIAVCMAHEASSQRLCAGYQRRRDTFHYSFFILVHRSQPWYFGCST